MKRRVRSRGAYATVWLPVLMALILTACGGSASPTTAGAAVSTTPTGALMGTTGPTATTAATPAVTSGTSGTPAAAGSPASGGPVKQVKLGVVFSLTGDAQIYGGPQKNGVQLAIDEINAGGLIPGIQLTPVFEDDGSKKDQGITVFDKLIKSDNVIAIVGPTLSNTALATDPVAQQAGVPVLGVSNTAGGITDIGNFIFRDSLAETQVIPLTIKQAKDKLGLKKVAVLYGNDDAFTKAGYDAFKKALDDNGIQIASTQTFAKGDSDFSAQLTAIKGSNPDAIVVSALINEATQIVTQARQLGIKATIIGGNGFNSPALIKNAKQAADGVVVGAAWNSSNDLPENQKFIQAYTAKFNTAPDQFAAQAYSGVYILAAALKAAGPNVDRKSLRDALAAVQRVPTPLGPFSFTAGRDADHPPVILIVKDGAFQVLK